jgi:hypothetical protein
MKKLLIAMLAVVTVMTACVKDEQYSGITINSLSYTPETVTYLDAVTIKANVNCFDDLTATLYYAVGDADYTSIEMTNVSTTTGATKEFSAVIPAQADGSTVKFYLAIASASVTKTTDVTKYEVGAYVADYSVLRLNELNGNDKFIELYNAGEVDINLVGVYIEKDGTVNWTATEAVVIPAGGFVLLYSEDVTSVGGEQEGYAEELTFHSGLSAKKAVRIQLFAPAGSSIDDFNLVECVTPAPASYSRNSDGNWYHADATPGAANVDGTDPVEGLE